MANRVRLSECLAGLIVLGIPVTSYGVPLSSYHELGTGGNGVIRDTRIPRESVPDRASEKKVPCNKKRAAKHVPKSKSVPMLRRSLSLTDIGKLPQAAPWFVKTSLALYHHLRDRDLRLLEYRYVDANGDGRWNVVVLSQHLGSRKASTVLGVYEFDEDDRVVLRYENRRDISLSEIDSYRQAIEPLEALTGFGLCEEWDIASWHLHECHELMMDDSWNPRVISHEVTTTEPRAHSMHTNRFNFAVHEGRRAYAHLPGGSFMPAIQRSSDYALMFAGRDENVIRAQDVPADQQAGYGDDHAPIAYGMRWNDDAVYMSFEVEDDSPERPDSCSDMTHVQYTDHMELWFDLNPSLNIRRDAPQTWQAEYETTYGQPPYRHEIDKDIYAFSVTASGCVVPMHPLREYWHVMPEVETVRTATGYRVHVRIPAAFYGVRRMSEIPSALGFGFTARQHDLHSDGSFSSVATSEWRWPDPFTFGQFWLSPRSRYTLPLFPMQWNQWLADTSEQK